jgi:hypothetical protein
MQEVASIARSGSVVFIMAKARGTSKTTAKKQKAKAPAKRPTKTPAKASSKTPAKASSKTPAKASSKTPAKRKGPAKPSPVVRVRAGQSKTPAVRQVPSRTPPKRSAAARPALPPTTDDLEKKYSFDELLARVGAPDEALREAMFEEVSESRLVDMGTSVESERLVKDVPIFVGSSLDIYDNLSEDQLDTLNLDDQLFPLIMDEARILRDDQREFQRAQTQAAGSRAQREAASRREMQAALALRNNLVGALRNALSEARQAKLDELVAGPGDDAERLADSIKRVTDFATELLSQGTPGEQRRLATYKVDAARVGKVSARIERVRAAAVEKAPQAQRVSQRLLDLQDGRVLFLMDRVLRAFRFARRVDSTILLPELRYVAGFFEIRTGRRPSKSGGDSGGPDGGPGGTTGGSGTP